ncbi:MAG: hypothetical protein RLY86_1180 [Pseudomonadota bacterium]|jgi:ribosome maturation factor RimP
MDVTTQIAAIIAPSLEGMGYELVRVHLSGGQRPILQIMAERAGQAAMTAGAMTVEAMTVEAMTVEDCADISRAVAALLDVEDPIPTAYVLEVSSPGIDAPLTRVKDFVRYAGLVARVETAELVENRKRFVGRILGVLDGDSAATAVIRIALDKEAAKPAKAKAAKDKGRKRKSAASSLSEPIPALAAPAETVTEPVAAQDGKADAGMEVRVPFALIQRARLVLTDELLARAAAARGGAAPGTEGGEMMVEDRPRRSRTGSREAEDTDGAG